MKKGQAAMEFIMSYGWAIMVVLIAIASLWYFGFIDPKDIVAVDVCQMSDGFSCVESKATENEIRLKIFSPPGKDMDVVGMSFKGPQIENCVLSVINRDNNIRRAVAGCFNEQISVPCTASRVDQYTVVPHPANSLLFDLNISGPLCDYPNNVEFDYNVSYEEYGSDIIHEFTGVIKLKVER